MPTLPGTPRLPHGLCGSSGSIKLLIPSALHRSGMSIHQKMCQTPAWARRRARKTLRGEPAQGSHSTNPAAPNSHACRLLSRAWQQELRRQEPEPNMPRQRGHGCCCFFTPVKRERGREKWGKNHTGVQPEPPACPSVVTVAAPGAAVSPTRNIWQAGFGPAMPLARHDSEKLPSPEEDSHPPKHQHCAGSGWDHTIRWGYS